MKNKFKAYDSYTNEIYPVIDISYDDNGEVDGIGFLFKDITLISESDDGYIGIYRDRKFMEKNPVILLPYIGLIYPNKEEAYYGDIVKWGEKSKCCGKVIYEYIGCIDWLEDGAMYIRRISLEGDHWVGFGNWYDDDVEKLGNKFKDIELYEKEFIPY